MMRTYILAGNAISLVAACFTMASSWSKDKKKIYLYQTIQCSLLAIANILFLSLSGTSTLILCAIRNALVAYDRFDKKLCGVFLGSIFISGILSNNRGAIGLIPVAATLIYTLGCLYAQKEISIKANIILNLILWGIYDIFVLDFVSCAVDAVSALLAIASLVTPLVTPLVSGTLTKFLR